MDRNWERYAIVARGGRWPATDGRILVDGGEVGTIGQEPWPAGLSRRWPDGVASRPWMMRVLGAGGDPCPSRLVVRDSSDGAPCLMLHTRSPLFRRTVGLFDGSDQRFAHVAWGWKGSGSGTDFRLFDVDHVELARTRASDRGVRLFGAASPNACWGEVVLDRGGAGSARRVEVVQRSETARASALLLAAAVVLWDGMGGET